MKHNRSLFERMETDWVWNLNSTFFLVKACFDSEGTTKHGLLPILSRKSQFYLIFPGQFVYSHPPWSLVVQCVEHLLTCQDESQMNNKAVYDLLQRARCIFITDDLRIVEAGFYCPSPFWKRDIFKFKFLGLFITGSLIRTFLWKCLPLLCRV